MIDCLSILPVNPAQLRAGLEEVIVSLAGVGLSKDEVLLKMSDDFDSWLDESNAVKVLPPPFEMLLNHAGWEAPKRQSRIGCYESMVKKVAKRFGISRRGAAMVLSHLPLMLILAKDFLASPARISCLLAQSDGRMSISWRIVDAVLREMGIKCDLNREAVESILKEDNELLAGELADATVHSMIEGLVELAASLGINRDFQASLATLFAPEGQQAFVPYLQILLYVSVIDVFFDHPPEYLYTFRPRGDVANFIFDLFPSTLAPGGNPALNNLKAVDRLTADWAESREEMREQSKALVEIVHGLSSLSFSSRCRLSAGLRRAILKFIAINTPADVSIPPVRSMKAVRGFLEQVCKQETGTRGVIEQRMADFFGVMQHQLPEWRSRGLGDPVNATNSSSAKLGDCDFQNIALQQCAAIEAHAGRLTDVYVRDHLRTLRLNLPLRQKEWARISDVEKWRVHVRFFVHEDARTESDAALPYGIKELKVITYAEQLRSMLSILEKDPNRTLEEFNRHVVERLNAPNTPLATKKKAKALFES